MLHVILCRLQSRVTQKLDTEWNNHRSDDRKMKSVVRQRTRDVVQVSFFWPESYSVMFVVQAEFAEAASNVSPSSDLQILSAKMEKSAFHSLAEIDICVEESASKHLRI